MGHQLYLRGAQVKSMCGKQRGPHLSTMFCSAHVFSPLICVSSWLMVSSFSWLLLNVDV